VTSNNNNREKGEVSMRERERERERGKRRRDERAARRLGYGDQIRESVGFMVSFFSVCVSTLQ
jgi:hypothetical protein